MTEDDIRRRLKNLEPAAPRTPHPGNFFNRPRKRAAVLIPFTRLGSDWHLLFIRRTNHEHDHHSGQVAFPGGGKDRRDPDINTTALREANEEVGLQPRDVKILGKLEDVISITNYHVTPVVGSFESPYAFEPDANEVARVFTIPLAWLSNPINQEVRYRKVDGQDPWPVIYFKEYDGEVLWGFTAALAIRLIEVLR